MHVSRPGCGAACWGSCSVFGLHWWAGVSYACVPSVVSCSSLWLPVHASPSPLFVTRCLRTMCSPTPRAPCVPAEGSSLPQTVRPGRVDTNVCVCSGNWSISDPVRFVLFCLFRPSAPALRCLRLITGAGGVAPPPWFQLYVRCAAPCRARGGCHAAVSVAGA